MSDNQSGMVIWHPLPPESDANSLVDIVFLHGLNGSIGNTFTQTTGRFGKRHRVTWPRDLLGEDLTVNGTLQARIMGFGFDADLFNFFGRKGRETIASTADTFLSALANVRREDYQRERPLIFFGHSLGGLIIKRALVKAWNEDDPSSGDVFRRRRLTATSTRAIIFAGTPHRGADAAQLATWSTSWLAAFGVPTSDENLRELQLGSNTTQMLREEFSVFRRKLRDSRMNMTPPRPDITIYTFCESLPMPVIVTKESAQMDSQNEIIVSIERRDHRTMVKFENRTEPGYIQFVAAMKDVIDEVRREKMASSSRPLTPYSTTSSPSATRNYALMPQAHEHFVWHNHDQHNSPQHLLQGRQAEYYTESTPGSLKGLGIYSNPHHESPRSSAELTISPQSVSPATVTPYESYHPTSTHQKTRDAEVESLLEAGRDRRLAATHTRDTVQALRLFERALHVSQQSRSPDLCNKTHAYFGMTDCFSDLSESKSSKLNLIQKIEYVRRAKNACSEALQLAQQGDNPGQARRARIYQARADAQDVILRSQLPVKDYGQLRTAKQAAALALQESLSELQRDVNREHLLWNLAEKKLAQLNEVRLRTPVRDYSFNHIDRVVSQPR
ncbi:uncharacterized protein N7482_004962 [Penicillium canariense]|uniref:DUF676 domain-containing protein n=1 Tax=Penicillium canariense TaxID=189055 RepID=A0A9W9LMJ8_9EURO|nr:uncharacterized protein N7482_004962 [Penicillium canariense]KAJ5166181.1 hypothetical protein N7482_004962 [Penicillium canariense]